MNLSWRFHCNIQSLEAFVILNNVKISNPLKIIWEGKEKKLVETCTWKQRRAVSIPNFSSCKFWGIPVEGGGALCPHHMPANLHVNLPCKTVLRISIMDQVLKVLLLTKTALNFYQVFRDIFFLDEFSSGSQNLAYCTKQWWHLFSKGTNNPWIEVVRKDVPAFFKKNLPSNSRFCPSSFKFFFVLKRVLCGCTNGIHSGMEHM